MLGPYRVLGPVAADRLPDANEPIAFPIGSLIAAAAVYLLDAIVLNQGAVAVLVALVSLAFAFAVALAPSPRPESGSRGAQVRRGVVRAGILVLAAAAVLGTNFWQNRMARRRAEAVIAACERYRAAKGRYPDKLAELVPAILPSEPRAKYVLLFGRFDYHALPAHHILAFTTLPPFGKPYYVLEERRWGYFD